MPKPRRDQLSLFDHNAQEKEPPLAEVVSFAHARAEEDARQSSQIDSRIIARVAHLLHGLVPGKSGA
jgi:hypothetical protein